MVSNIWSTKRKTQERVDISTRNQQAAGAVRYRRYANHQHLYIQQSKSPSVGALAKNETPRHPKDVRLTKNKLLKELKRTNPWSDYVAHDIESRARCMIIGLE